MQHRYFVAIRKQSGIKKRSVTIAAGFILIGLSLVPKITALATLIPTAVRGATVIMFGMVVSSGIRILNGIDFSNNDNLLIIACSISLGLGATVVPELFAVLPPTLHILFGDGIIEGSLTSIILNLSLTKRTKKSIEVVSNLVVDEPSLKSS